MLPPKQGGYGMSSVLEDSRRHHDFFPGSTAHDAVLVLDPSPGESFGHPVVLFYVDLNTTKKKCAHMDGIYLGEECLTLALKSRCQNQLKRRQSGSERLAGSGRARRATVSRPRSSPGRMERSGALCEIHFLPMVVGVRDTNRTQRLRCVDHPDFAQCPQPLPLTSPNMPVSSCELNKNTRRCHQQPLATHLSCRLYQTCDHAILLSGGWQQQITYQCHVQNLQLFYRMLRNNGFHRDHIKTFFAGNGQLSEEWVYPATEKRVIRNHISYICGKQHCADSWSSTSTAPPGTTGPCCSGMATTMAYVELNRNINDPHGSPAGLNRYINDPHGSPAGLNHNINDPHGSPAGLNRYINDPHGSPAGLNRYINDPHGSPAGLNHNINDPHGSPAGLNHNINDPHGSPAGLNRYINDPHGSPAGLNRNINDPHGSPAGLNHNINDPHGSPAGLNHNINDPHGSPAGLNHNINDLTVLLPG
ncbi:uncharacterized protein LOC121843536 [Oncorhynchus tshawytscha]|uniref:uncharacterized protein LOC121843536 n=1 Tax=Oncorhynchus tshawytscha TaxID=74940 RepID=UPI001C3D4B61|nr:uncharacterized protein LOC121843536 [Oncorhynchus tshawytscha]